MSPVRMKAPLESALFRLAGRFKPGRSAAGELPPEAAAYLTRENPRLVELKQRYARAVASEQSFWIPWESKIELRRFRGEDDYVSQTYYRGTRRRYELTWAYVEATDRFSLLPALSEDTLFGAKAFEIVPGKLATRDLLDSILETTFVMNALSLTRESRIRLLDIGAGYGRFGHRFTAALPHAQVSCTDAVATSTFLSEFYLRFRGSSARVVPFDELDALQPGSFDLATNIHSWSECTREFVNFWLGRVRDLKIDHLLIVPHTNEFLTKETDGSCISYFPDLEKHGFVPVLREAKFARSELVQRDGIFPAEYWLFKRK